MKGVLFIFYFCERITTNVKQRFMLSFRLSSSGRTGGGVTRRSNSDGARRYRFAKFGTTVGDTHVALRTLHRSAGRVFSATTSCFRPSGRSHVGCNAAWVDPGSSGFRVPSRIPKRVR